MVTLGDSQHGRANNVEPAEGELLMRISTEERATLAAALAELGRGDSRRFCDLMWLGFGDKWRDLLRSLAERMVVAINDPECTEGIAITERGRVWAASLAKSPRRN